MTEIIELLKGHQLFHNKYFRVNPDLYKKLSTEGQSPSVLVISCSDSRVDPSIVLNTDPGDLFVIRNVANIVPPYENEEIACHGTSAAIEYAVNHLKIKDLIIFGHSQCGGIKTLIEDEENNHTFIDNWIYIVQEAKEKALAQNLSHEECCRCCEKEAIKISIKNLLTFPFIKERIEKNLLQLHGWYFNLESGHIEIIETV